MSTVVTRTTWLDHVARRGAKRARRLRGWVFPRDQDQDGPWAQGLARVEHEVIEEDDLASWTVSDDQRGQIVGGGHWCPGHSGGLALTWVST